MPSKNHPEPPREALCPVESCVVRRSALLALLLLTAGCNRGGVSTAAEPYLDLAARAAILRAETEEPSTAIGVEAAGDLLFLPTGTSTEYLLFAEANSTLRVEEVVSKGVGSRLEVLVETDREGERELAVVHGSKQDLVIPLEIGTREPFRLSLLSMADEGDSESGVLLRKPTLWAPGRRQEAAPEITVEPRHRRPHVLVYLVDTLRADRLGCYGYDRPISPNIDRFADRSSLFLNAIGQSSWTKASVGSIFTGLWPPAHGAIGWKHKLTDEIVTLAEYLQTGGYQTAAFVTNPNVVQAFGFTQGFDEFTRKLRRPSDQVNEMVFEWLGGRDLERPFLLYVHTMDPHAPYAPPEPYRSRFATDADQMPNWQPRWRWPMEALPYLSNLYDAEIAFNDDSFGKLLAFLEDEEIYDDTLIILASDHGEEFKEHGRWRHGANLHAVTLNFPLIVKFPDQRLGTRVEEAVQHIDLLPTILGSAGRAIPDHLEGRDLAALTKVGSSAAGPASPEIYSHLRLGRGALNHSVVSGSWKLIRRLGDSGWELSLFDWQEDPDEGRDLAPELPVLAAVLSAQIDDKVRSLQAAEAAEEITLTEELEADLRALGYLE